MRKSSSVAKQEYKVVIRPSRIQGKGLFAAQKIPEGEWVMRYTGQKVSRREGARRERYYNSIGYSLLFDLEDCYLDGLIGGNESIYINHSLSPNLEARVRRGGVWFHSLRAIGKGEELTFDYGFDPVKPKPR
jgi:SET domain-containing protein